MGIYGGIKIFLDTLFAFFLIIVLSPLLIIVALLIKLDSNGPVLFRQKRIAKDCKEFSIYKFRTMVMESPKDMPTHLFQSAENFITKSGRLLRKTSLDELPQLFNILKGEMSFIGPRPALWNQFDLIQAREAQYQRVGKSANAIRPGITGWAQVNGRDDITIEQKADYDGYYARNISFFLDLKIIFMTIKSVISQEGISEGGPISK